MIGNPPYVNGEGILTEDRDYLMKTFKSAAKKFDIYIPFIEKGLGLIRMRGNHSFIIPYPFLYESYGEILRKQITNTWIIKSILDLRKIRVFETMGGKKYCLYF